MREELAALVCTGTWEIVSLPSHAVPISCKWVYKVKTKYDGSIERYKARLVTRWFKRTQGQDYDETFAPVPHTTMVQTLLDVAAASSWTTSQMDVKNAPPPSIDTPLGHIIAFVKHYIIWNKLLVLVLRDLLLTYRLLVSLLVIMIFIYSSLSTRMNFTTVICWWHVEYWWWSRTYFSEEEASLWGISDVWLGSSQLFLGHWGFANYQRLLLALVNTSTYKILLLAMVSMIIA
jgi:hypothetical protein